MQNISEALGIEKQTSLPMPSLNCRVIQEPSEIEVAMVIKLAGKGELHKIPRHLEGWVCYRLMPSLFRFGAYPPPYEAAASNESNFSVSQN